MIEEMLVGCYLNELNRTLARSALIVEVRRLQSRGRVHDRPLAAIAAPAGGCVCAQGTAA